MHICEQCAKENSDSYGISGNHGFSIHNLLSGLLNMDSSFQSAGTQMFNHSEPGSACKKCGMTFQQFRKTGVLAVRNVTKRSIVISLLYCVRYTAEILFMPGKFQNA